MTSASSTGTVSVAVVIPAYNEARRLPHALDAWLAFAAGQPYDLSVHVADDGSSDDTPVVVQEHSRRNSAIKLVKLPSNQGKGGAVRAGMLAALSSGPDFLFYADADLNISPDHVPAALQHLQGGAGLVAGQRGLAAYAGQERSFGRLAAGAIVQATRRAIVLPVIRDTQCGFKGFRRDIARAIFERTLIRSFAFDIEVLFLARQLHAPIVELPVTTEYRAESTYVLRKHLPPFVRDIVRIRLNHLRGRYRLQNVGYDAGPTRPA